MRIEADVRQILSLRKNMSTSGTERVTFDSPWGHNGNIEKLPVVTGSFSMLASNLYCLRTVVTGGAM